MKQVKLICLIFFLLGWLTTGAAWAHGRGFGGGGHFGGGHFGGGHFGGHFHGHPGFFGHPHLGVFIGAPFGWPYYYPYYPYYPYPPAVVTAPSSPPVYIQQGGGQPAPQGQTNYWYYCDNPQGYYPYVRECPGGWQPVSPQPPPPR